MQSFHPIISDWFERTYGSPTEIQSMAWPRIAGGDHLLITAPTGSGKTLTAFLWALNRFITGDLEIGSTRVLYISPLKALNNDIQRNLTTPLTELKRRFDEAGEPFPDIKVMTRSGDTDSESRRRMLRHPPEILITTPESLNLLLSSRGGQGLLYDIDTVILDEIHAVVESKRGVFLMSAIERLVPMSGEFQRIALSATVNPLDQVADFVGGFERHGDSFTPRAVAILKSNAHKQYDICVRYPEEAAKRGEDEKVWDYLAGDILTRIQQNTSTLVFVNSRALCEKLTFKINNAAGRLAAYAHHGSLSREIRTEVESRLKAGKLEAIVATSSLEMGIDIGALDEVILVQSPGSIASTIQRIGRAGHQVGAASRCTIYPTHPQDFVEAAVLADAVIEKDLEPIRLINRPLDVLGQVIVSMTGTASWQLDDLFHEIRRSTAYRHLSRVEFDLVINMLAGRYADHHIRELKPRVRVDRVNNTIEARKGALLSLYLSGGVIPDRGYFQLRHEDDNAKIGELDEEFVWEANVGQVFSLGTQTWQVKKITHNDVVVGPGKPGSSAPPFWKAEPLSRSFHYATRIGRFLEEANTRLEDEEFEEELQARFHSEPRVAAEIINFLSRQREHTRTDLPHRHHLLVEKIRSGPQRAPGHQVVIHSGWGAAVNRPFAMALEAAWQDSFAEQPEVFVANESIVVQLPEELNAERIFSLVTPEKIETLLRHRLEGSGFFGARFRENAGRSLLLSKGRFNERKPLWMSRLQSQKLLDNVLKYEDFPILLETWRTCLQDEFDLDGLRLMLEEVARREIQVTEVETPSPSPFAASVAWDQINVYMYMSDTPKSQVSSSLSKSLLEEVVYSPALRPPLNPDLVQALQVRLHRLSEGYAPADQTELIDWVIERSFIPGEEWQQLIERLDFDPAHKLIDTTTFASTFASGVCAAENTKTLQALLQHEATERADGFSTFLANWLQHYGPISMEKMAALLQVPHEHLHDALGELLHDETIIEGKLLEADDRIYYCDASNYEHLLRLARRANRPTTTTRAISNLPTFMYTWQQRFSNGDPVDQLFESIEQLRGYPAAPELWEADFLPSRISNYSTQHMDVLFSEGELQWLGTGKKQVTFCFTTDNDLLLPGDAESELIRDDHARYDFGGLSDLTGLSYHDLAEKLWGEVWQGKIANDSVATLRQGIAHRFSIPDISSMDMRRSRRGAINRVRGSTPATGTWYALSREAEEDLLTREELAKDRARLLLNRYGVLFRELVVREGQTPWKDIFRALRLMELSGEVVSGRFFDKVPGPQYMTETSLRHFNTCTDTPVFFINAADPVSPSGLGIDVFEHPVPSRLTSNHMVIHGDSLVMTSRKNGRSIDIHRTENDPELPRYLQLFHHLAYRSFNPVKQPRIDDINGGPARSSGYIAAFETTFNVIHDYKSVMIQREL